MTLASPITTAPVPEEISKNCCCCANRLPDSATRPFAAESPRIFIFPRSCPIAVTMDGLSPTARSKNPEPVFKYQSSTSFTASTMTSITAAVCHTPVCPNMPFTTPLSNTVGFL